MEKFDSFEQRIKIFITYVFYYMNREKTNRFLEEQESEIYSQLKDYSREFTGEYPESPEHLDYLWGSFFASGRYEYILLLVNAMELSQSNPLVCAAAEWSLSGNCKQHKLVKEYCEYIYMYEDVSQTVRDKLEDILDE
jgi:hypothetical protein